MRIIHIVRSLIVNSGVSVFAAELASAQAERGDKVTLIHRWHPGYGVSNKVRVIENKRVVYELAKIDSPDIVHIHALWSLEVVQAMYWCWWHKVKYVVSPHGGLMPRVFTKGWLKKHVYYWVFLHFALKHAAAIHCTGNAEAEVIQKLIPSAKIIIAPLGCKIPNNVESRVDKLGDRKVLFLGRISEEKGLMFLLDAWKKVRRDGWKLIIAGPDWHGYGKRLREKVEVEKIGGVEFPGSADATLKDKLYREADVFILPSPMENFGAVVLDALAYKLPVICTRGTPWEVIEKERCGWWIEPNSADAIASSLASAMGRSEKDREVMGQRANDIALLHTWKIVANNINKSLELM